MDASSKQVANKDKHTINFTSIDPRFCHLKLLNEPRRVSNLKVNLCDASGTN